MSDRVDNVLTIAGSDSGGGAGIQADLKTFSALGAYGASVITSVTAQNTQGVAAIHPVPVSVIASQIDAVLSDIDIQGVKTGMLGQAETISVVAEKLTEYDQTNLVVDPVMISTSGSRLLDEDAVITLKQQLIPIAKVITPNLFEAAALLDCAVPETLEQMKAMLTSLKQLGSEYVLLKGGHLHGDKTDLLFDGQDIVTLPAKHVNTENTHGTGCTLASAVVVGLASGDDMLTATRKAKSYITAALEAADQLNVGQGSGPVNHFYNIWQR